MQGRANAFSLRLYLFLYRLGSRSVVAKRMQLLCSLATLISLLRLRVSYAFRTLPVFKDSNARMITNGARSSHLFSRRRRAEAVPKRPAVILYAEKNRTLQVVVRDVLEFAGWYVRTCSDSPMALALAESDQHFDLFIVDAELDIIDGIEVMRRARLKEHRRQTPFVLVSLFDRAEEARQAGADAFLRKPNNLLELVGTIRQLLAARGGE